MRVAGAITRQRKRRLASPPTASSRKSRRLLLRRVGECLYRANSGVYYGIVKTHGRQFRKNLGTTLRTLARHRLDELRRKIHQATPTPRQQDYATFEEVAELWVAAWSVGVKENTVKRRRLALTALYNFFGKRPLRNITRIDCERWSTVRAQQIQPRSYNTEVETFRLVMNYGIDLGLLLENPASRLRRLRIPKPMVTIPSRQQFCDLLLAMRSDEGKRPAQSADLVEFLGYSGCRWGEALAVCWRDVDFESNVLRITGGRAGTKTGEERAIPMFAPLERLLRDLRSADTRGDDEPIFQVKSAKKAVGSACRKLNLPHFRPHHTFRHFFASNAIEEGVPFHVVARWLGHSDGGTLVATIYGHLRDEHSMEMAKRMTFDAGPANPPTPSTH